MSELAELLDQVKRVVVQQLSNAEHIIVLRDAEIVKLKNEVKGLERHKEIIDKIKQLIPRINGQASLVENLKSYLDSIQPKYPCNGYYLFSTVDYIALKEAIGIPLGGQITPTQLIAKLKERRAPAQLDALREAVGLSPGIGDIDEITKRAAEQRRKIVAMYKTLTTG